LCGPSKRDYEMEGFGLAISLT